MATKKVDVPGIGSISLTKRRGTSNIRLSYARDGSIRVSLPYYVPFKTGIDFARSRIDWLTANKPDSSPELQNGDRIGKAHRLVIETSNYSEKPTVRVANQRINVLLPLGISPGSEEALKTIERGSHRALKKESESLLPPRLNRIAKQFGFEYKSVKTKRLVSRWGSCSQLKDIVLNIYLMQLPWELIDYVILHELVHTEHMDHSKDFWDRFNQVLPDAKKHRKELKKYKTAIIPTRDTPLR